MYESNWLLNNKNHTHPAPTTTFTIQSSCWLLVVLNDLPRTLTEMSSICNNDDFWFPCFVFGCTEPHTTIILTIATNGKTYQSGQDDNQIGCGWFWMGNRTSSTQQVKYVGYNVCVCFGSYFMSPKWTRTNIAICVFSASNGLSLSTKCTGVVWPLEN